MKIIKTYIIIIALSTSLYSQSMEETLFGEVNKKIENAKANSLDILSPSYFEQAYSDYQEAKEDFEKGANLKDIRELIEEINKNLNTAESKAEVSKITLKSSIKARNDARKVEAETHSPEIWKSAEEKFRDAGEEVEDGDIPDAEDASREAEDLYRSAELNSIKILYLDESWKLINEAKDQEAETFTPITLAKAIDLAKEAEKVLSENRYDTDLPRSLAQQAKYEANHSIFLTMFIRDFEDTEKSLEELLLTYEDPMKKISSHFDYEAKFDQPNESITNEIVQRIVKLKTKYHDEAQKNMELDQELKILRDELGGLSKEKSELDKKMAKLAEQKAKYEKVSNSFTSNEAEIFKEGSNIYIRLVGLSFPVGKSIIESDNFVLLAKVQNAIKLYPNSTIVIEGHTDSYGGDEKNLDLSQERASAVKQYILANVNLDNKQVKAFGYGETKPIANNETKEGRAKNRRIDLIIKSEE